MFIFVLLVGIIQSIGELVGGKPSAALGDSLTPLVLVFVWRVVLPCMAKRMKDERY